MSTFDRKDIAELVGLTAIVVSLIFVGVQLRQTQDIAIAEGFLSMFELRTEVSNGIRENIEIWREGTAGNELSDNDAAVFAILVNQVNEAAVQAFYHTFNIEGKVAAGLAAEDFAGFLYHNPGARKLWVQREEFLLQNRSLLNTNNTSEPWTEAVNERLSILDDRQPIVNNKPDVDW